jgi:hypothetical protein
MIHRIVKCSLANVLNNLFSQHVVQKEFASPVRREQDRPAPRHRRACQVDSRHFITIRPIRSAYAPHALFWRRGSTGPSTRTLFCADRSGAGPASLPGTSPAAPDRWRSGRAPEKAYDAKNSKAARPKGTCCRVGPSPLRILTIIGRVMRRRGGAVGRHSPGLIPGSPRFHKTF